MNLNIRIKEEDLQLIDQAKKRQNHKNVSDTVRTAIKVYSLIKPVYED